MDLNPNTSTIVFGCANYEISHLNIFCIAVNANCAMPKWRGDWINHDEG